VRAAYKAALARAGLRSLRFHDLRHTFGTRTVEQADSILELKEWMGHANVQTTMRYLHYKSKTDAARRLGAAFAEEGPEEPERITGQPAATRSSKRTAGPRNAPDVRRHGSAQSKAVELEIDMVENIRAAHDAHAGECTQPPKAILFHPGNHCLIGDLGRGRKTLRS
jgi:hypothetical protein